MQLFQLEKAREATDAANIRAAYAEVMTAALTDEGETTKTVDLTQTKADWQSEITLPKDLKATGTPSEKGKATVTYDKAKDEVTVTYAAGNWNNKEFILRLY